MFYVADNRTSRKEFDGSIVVSEQVFNQCRDAQLNGNGFGIRDGDVRIWSSTKRSVYKTDDQSKLEIPENDDTPDGYTDLVPEPGQEWDGADWVNPVPNVQQIKNEARRRIDAVMPTWVVDRANTGGPRVPANVLAYVKLVRETSDTLEGTLPTDYADDSHWPSVPDPIVFEPAPILTRKDDIWGRATEAEAELIKGALDLAPAKLWGFWNDNPYISHSHSEFQTLRTSLIDVLAGNANPEDRADELLAESEIL